jgi:hypothetical protein
VAFDPKADLHEYLQSGREVMLWKLEGLSEYDIRRPLVRTGTNLLGLHDLDHRARDATPPPERSAGHA